ncbi:hypothetical protein FLG15_01800 [Xanthomonas phaseoli pv. dieffenbachiae]
MTAAQWLRPHRAPAEWFRGERSGLDAEACACQSCIRIFYEAPAQVSRWPRSPQAIPPGLQAASQGRRWPWPNTLRHLQSAIRHPPSAIRHPPIPNPESRIPNPESRIPNPESRIPAAAALPCVARSSARCHARRQEPA